MTIKSRPIILVVLSFAEISASHPTFGGYFVSLYPVAVTSKEIAPVIAAAKNSIARFAIGVRNAGLKVIVTGAS